MIFKFHFKGFEPTEDLQNKADMALDRLLERAPFGSYVNAMIEKEGSHYRCTINLYSSQGPFFASAVGSNVLGSLERAEGMLSKKLKQWKNNIYEHQQLIA